MFILPAGPASPLGPGRPLYPFSPFCPAMPGRPGAPERSDFSMQYIWIHLFYLAIHLGQVNPIEIRRKNKCKLSNSVERMKIYSFAR